MSHFSVCTIVPSTYNGSKLSIQGANVRLDELMEPFDEASTSPYYTEYVDRTEDAKDEFEHGTVHAVKDETGKILTEIDDDFHKRFTVQSGKVMLKGNTYKDPAEELTEGLEAIPDYPLKKLYENFDQFCREYYGYRKNSEGKFGFVHNPHAAWDWYEIGGRFSGALLVKADLMEIFPVTEGKPDDMIMGDFRRVNGARKKDICWDEMLRRRIESAKLTFPKLEEAFRTGNAEDLGPLTSVTENGIESWGDLIYSKGESLEEFMRRYGADNTQKYCIGSYAMIDIYGDWHSRGHMGWWGMSTGDKPEEEWKNEIQGLIAEADDDDFIIMIDCHI